MITLGRGARAEHLLASEASLPSAASRSRQRSRRGDHAARAGAARCLSDRGLAPGRSDVRRYVRDLSATMRELIAPYGVQAGEITGLIGVWVDSAERRRVARRGAGAGPAKNRRDRGAALALGLDARLRAESEAGPVAVSADRALRRHRLRRLLAGESGAARARGERPRAPSASSPRRAARAAPRNFLDVSEAPLAELVRLAELGGPWGGGVGRLLIEFSPEA